MTGAAAGKQRLLEGATRPLLAAMQGHCEPGGSVAFGADVRLRKQPLIELISHPRRVAEVDPTPVSTSSGSAIM